MTSFGWTVHPDAPASATDAPISVRNRRREVGLFQSGVRFGNSSSTNARNSSVEASSSKLRQYFISFIGGKSRSRLSFGSYRAKQDSAQSRPDSGPGSHKRY